MAKNDTTLYLYELAWMLPSVALPVGMLAALLVTAFGAHIHLPGQEVTIDPAHIDTTAPFDQPGIVEVGPGRYEARIIAGMARSPIRVTEAPIMPVAAAKIVHVASVARASEPRIGPIAT